MNSTSSLSSSLLAASEITFANSSTTVRLNNNNNETTTRIEPGWRDKTFEDLKQLANYNEPSRLELADQQTVRAGPSRQEEADEGRLAIKQQQHTQEEARNNELVSQRHQQANEGVSEGAPGEMPQPQHSPSSSPNAKEALIRKREEQKSETNDESKADNSRSISFDEMPINNNNNSNQNNDNNVQQSGEQNQKQQTQSQQEAGGSSSSFVDDYLDSIEEAPPDDELENHLESVSSGSIDRRAFLMNSYMGNKNNSNNSSSSRLAALISNRPIANELRKLTKNSSVLRALEKRRLRQRERLKMRNNKLNSTTNNNQNNNNINRQPDRTRLVSNKKRDLLNQAAVAQTRQGLTSTTTLGPGQSLLAFSSGVASSSNHNNNHHHNNLSLKANALKHLPSLASSSNQISSAIQRLISNKLGITTTTSANPDLMIMNNNNHNNHHQHSNQTLRDLSAKKLSSLFEATDSQLLRLAQQQHQHNNYQDEQADFSSTSASDHHQNSLLPSSSSAGNFAGSSHHFDVSNSDGNQELDEIEQLGGDRLAGLMSQWSGGGGGGGSGDRDELNDDQGVSTSSLLGLQAARKYNQKLANNNNTPFGHLAPSLQRPSLGTPGSHGGHNNQHQGTSATTTGQQQQDKQVIPIEIIGLDPSVTNTILYGSTNQQQQQQSQQHGQSQRHQGQFMSGSDGSAGLDDTPNPVGGQGSAGQGNQVVSASELDIHENPLVSLAGQDGFKPNQNQLDQAQVDVTGSSLGGANSMQAGPVGGQDGGGPATTRPIPSSVLHIHHFHHTTEPDAATKQQQPQRDVDSGELDAGNNRLQQQQISELTGDTRQQQQQADSQQGTTELPDPAGLAGKTADSSSESQTSKGGNGEQAAAPGGTVATQAQEGAEQGEPVAGPEQQQQLQVSAGDEDKLMSMAGKKMRFVTRNSLRDKNQANHNHAAEGVILNNSNPTVRNILVGSQKTITPSVTSQASIGFGASSRLNHSVPFHGMTKEQQTTSRFMPIRGPAGSAVSTYGNDLASDGGQSGNDNNNMLMVAYRPAGRVLPSSNQYNFNQHQQLNDGPFTASPLGPNSVTLPATSSVVQHYHQHQHQRQQQQQQRQQHQHNYRDFSLPMNLVNEGGGGASNQTLMLQGGDEGGAEPGLHHYNTPTRYHQQQHHLLPYNEGSESSQLLSSAALAQQLQQQRQRLIGSSAVAINSTIRSPQSIGPTSNQLAAALLKQAKLNPALLAQPQDKLASAQMAATSADNDNASWTNEDDRLLAQYNGLANGSRNINNQNQNQNNREFGRGQASQQSKLISPVHNHHHHYTNTNTLDSHRPRHQNITTYNNHQSQLDAQNPFQNHYQNFVENLVMMKQQQQQMNNHQQGVMPFSDKEVANGHLTSRLTSNELAMIMQEQLSKQMLNRTVPGAGGMDGLGQNATSAGRYELTSASDRAPAKLMRDQQQHQHQRTKKPNTQIFSANENFHVPNTSTSLNSNQKLPSGAGSAVFTTNKHLMDRLNGNPASSTTIAGDPGSGSSVGLASNAGELETGKFTRNSGAGAGGSSNATDVRPVLGQGGPLGPSTGSGESFIDSAEGLSNLALAFIFVVTLLTFLMIAVSMVYRRRRSARTSRCSTSGIMPASDLSTGGGPSSRSSGRFNIAQRTRHLMGSNMFASVMQTKAKVAAASGGGGDLGAGQTSNASSSMTSITRLGASLGAPPQVNRNNEPPVTGANQHTSDSRTRLAAAQSIWSKHLKRVPTAHPPNVSHSKLRTSIDNNKYQSTDGGTTSSANDEPLTMNPDSDIRTLNTRRQKATYMLQMRAGQEAAAKQQQQHGGGGLHNKQKHQASDTTTTLAQQIRKKASMQQQQQQQHIGQTVASAVVLGASGGQNLRSNCKSSPVGQVDPYTRSTMIL